MTIVVLSDRTWLALCIWTEARGEPADGQAAVAQVVLNRTRLRYASDGTIRGTVLARDQFSAFWFEFTDGAYHRVCETEAQAEARGLKLYDMAWGELLHFGACVRVAAEVLAGAYAGGFGFERIGHDTVNYCNLAISHPSWAAPPRTPVAVIGRHSFFRAA